MSGDDGRFPVTPESPEWLPEGSIVATVWISPPNNSGWHTIYGPSGNVAGLYPDKIEAAGLPVPPKPPGKVTLSIELDEADVRAIARLSTDTSEPRDPYQHAKNARNAACRAWVAANPEGEKP